MFTETPRLTLRDLRQDDLASLHAISSDPETMRMMESYLPPDEAALRKWLEETIWHNEQRPRTAHNCAIVLKATNGVIGWIGFGVPSDPMKGSIDFGYALNRNFHNRGYATEALKAMLAYCFDVLHADSVSAYHLDFNPASGRVMQKAGMRSHTDMMREAKSGEVHYIITAAEWRATQNETLTGL